MTPPSLANRIRRVLDECEILDRTSILLACSGGIDSQVMLDTMAHLAKSGRIRVFAHGVDHGLRPEAASELRLVSDLAGARGVPFSSTTVQVQKGSNLQARAREARYTALRAAAKQHGCSLIATAHHKDDHAETVLIRLLRGAPIEGLAVLPVLSRDLIRPLLKASRAEIEAAAVRRRLSFAKDPSNLNERYLRVRVRHQLLPLMKKLDPKIVEHLVGISERALNLSGKS